MDIFECPECKCRRFWRVRHLELLVDWGREGAVKGHPFLEGPEREYMPVWFRCAECGYHIRHTVTLEKMAKAVL